MEAFVHGKYSTAAMVHALNQNRKLDKPLGHTSRAVAGAGSAARNGGKDKNAAAAATSKAVEPEPTTVKGALMAVAGSFINRLHLLTKKASEGEDRKPMSREAKALLQHPAGKGKNRFDVERLSDPAADSAVKDLRKRYAENTQKASDSALWHKCTSRCADGKCTKFDWDHNCPVQCSCNAETPYSKEPCILWEGKWCFCEWYV